MRKVRLNLGLMAFLATVVSFTQTSNPCLAEGKDHHLVEQTMVIKAPAKLVFEGIQMSRSADPERRHLVSHHQDVAVIDEKLADLPVIGTAHLVYKEIEVPFKRIDYLLVSSDKFKAFEGSWELTPLDNGQETRVCLRSYSDLKVWVPFAGNLNATSTLKDINRRLANLKHWCDQQGSRECSHEEIAETRSSTHIHSQSRLAENHLHSKAHADQEDISHLENSDSKNNNEEHK